jgi:hypothetical protein
MAKLVLIHESGQTAEFDLRPGRNTIGRAADNDLSVEDESISGHHCELHETAEGVRVRDLGSLHGTWIDTTRIEEGRLELGQTLQIGQVQFVLEASAPPLASAASAPPLRVGVESRTSITGDHVPGSLFCGRCAQWYPPGRTSERRVGATILHFCPRCGSACGPGVTSASQRATAAEMTFIQGALGAFGYPLRASGGVLILAGAVALTLTDYARFLAGYAPLLGLVALVFLFIGVTGYLFAFAKDVVATSAQGEASLPSWPEVTSPADFAVPCGQFLALALICFGPLLVWEKWQPEDTSIWISVLLTAAGAFYFPMALVGVALADSIAGVNPAVIVPSILKILGHYLMAFALVVLLVAAQWAGEWLARRMAIPLLPTFLAELITLYLIVVTARVLGIMYYVNRERLGWFR